MEQDYIEGGVRERLIQAGITEIYEHGISDFSLRRVALAAQVSCAAPYRHFKDKDDMIARIIEYVTSKRELFSREIVEVFSSNVRMRVIELSIANLRFWLANPRFSSVLTECRGIDGASKIIFGFDSSLSRAIEEYAEARGQDPEPLIFTTRALIYGAVLLVDSSEYAENSRAISYLRARLMEDFPE